MTGRTPACRVAAWLAAAAFAQRVGERTRRCNIVRRRAALAPGVVRAAGEGERDRPHPLRPEPVSRRSRSSPRRGTPAGRSRRHPTVQEHRQVRRNRAHHPLGHLAVLQLGARADAVRQHARRAAESRRVLGVERRRAHHHHPPAPGDQVVGRSSADRRRLHVPPRARLAGPRHLARWSTAWSRAASS